MKAKVVKARHIFQFIRLFTKFQIEFRQLRQEIENEIASCGVTEDEEINLHYSIIGGEIGEFEFIDW